jgi:hypothetical protein
LSISCQSCSGYPLSTKPSYLLARGVLGKAGADITSRRLGAVFPGTIASFEINTADRNKYELDQIVSPYNIW